jgi:hypothetical protein
VIHNQIKLFAIRRTQSGPQLDQILKSLSISEEPFFQSYRTSSLEDYKVLVEQALNGQLEGIVTVGRSGIYLNDALISPPADE